MRTVVYMAHPLSGDFENNIHNGNLWFRFLRSLSVAGVAKLLEGQSVNRRAISVEKYPGKPEVRTILVRPFDEPPVIVAPWLTCPLPDHKYPGGRPKALNDGLAVIGLLDEVWCVGGRISQGMLGESIVAKCARDLTHWGVKPPVWEDKSLFII